MSEKKTEIQEEVFQTIEELQAKHQVSRTVMEGVKAANSWRAGKQVTEKEFLKAWDLFLHAPADGRRDKK